MLFLRMFLCAYGVQRLCDAEMTAKGKRDYVSIPVGDRHVGGLGAWNIYTLDYCIKKIQIRIRYLLVITWGNDRILNIHDKHIL